MAQQVKFKKSSWGNARFGKNAVRTQKGGKPGIAKLKPDYSEKRNNSDYIQIYMSEGNFNRSYQEDVPNNYNMLE